MMKNICFVVTNFNNTDYTELLISSIEQSDAKGSVVIVVDNASEIKHIEALRVLESKYSNLKVIYNNSNIGYFSGLNVGIKFAKEKYPFIKYMIIGNNDLLFSADFYASILKSEYRFETHPVVSPNITMLDGTPQNPHVISRISRAREFVYDLYHFNYYLAGLIIKIAKITHRFTDRDDEQQCDIAQEIYQGYGACYILGPKFFENYKELWSPTFLMYEEYFLSKQLEDKGFKVFYEPIIKVQHYCHASMGQIPGRKRWEFSRDAHHEYRKYVKFWH